MGKLIVSAHNLFFLALFFVLSQFFYCSNISLKKSKNNTQQSVHLVLNSTGYATEFCVFQIEKSDNFNFECKAEKPKEYAKCVEYFADNTNFPTYTSRETLDQIYKGLAEMELARPLLKNKIKSVGYLASGSFNAAKDYETKQVLKDVESYFLSEKLNIKTKSLTPEEEVKTTFKSIANTKQSSMPTAILQIGPASVEVGIDSEKEGKVSSSKIGIHSLIEEISQIKPGINSCRQPISSFFKSEASSFDKCKSFILENMNKSNRLSSITKIKLGDYEVYSTGAMWNNYYPTKEELSVQELNEIGKEFCSLTIDEIQKKGIKKRNAYNLCYALSYTATLVESLDIKKLKILPKDAYIKNFATSSTLFPEFCK